MRKGILLTAVVTVAMSSLAIAQQSQREMATTIRDLEFNTADLEYAPTITADGNTLYFCSNRGGGQGGHDIWMVSREDDGAFRTAFNLPSPVNTGLNEGAASIAADGRTIYFTGCSREDGLGDCDIYSAELENGEFTNIQNVIVVNTPFWDSEPSISPDGRALYFISNRPGATGGDGDVDIWASRREAGGEWGTPTNLGAPINTAQREDSPFLHSSGELLYFGSAGHGGEGALDFFVSRREGDGWSSPVNLGKPINSPKDDRFITVPASGSEIYFSSDRTEPSNAGQLDVFVATVAPQAVTVLIRGRAFDYETGIGLVADIIFTDAASGEVISSTRSRDANGAYTLAVSAARAAAIRAQGVVPGYRNVDETIDIPATDQYLEIEKDFRFVSINSSADDARENERSVIAVKPNPAKDRITVTVTRTGIGDELEIYDAYGHRIEARKFAGSTSTIDVSGFASGIYLARIGRFSAPFVVRK